jgi:hypothetical protein
MVVGDPAENKVVVGVAEEGPVEDKVLVADAVKVA